MTRLLALCFLLLSWHTYSQSYEWLPDATYAPDIPTPEEVFGYEIGDYLTDNLQMVDYIHRLQSSSERVKVMQYGESVERRKLWLVIISSPENMNRLEEIRTTVARLKDPRQTSLEQAREIAQSTVPIAWMNFGTDGNETSAFEAGIQLAYQLTAGTDPLTTKIIENAVVIINPALNPDSHQPFVGWMKSSTINGGTADPQASEHFAEWFVSSDGNHFKIDLNRDAFVLTQPETRAASTMLQHWNPQVWMDMHGEPNEYYMSPFTSPVNLNYPESLKKWAVEVGKNTAKYFDGYGWTYVKDENYDLFFPGYWDSYPAFNGAIAATYESNGGGKKGFAWERPDGTIVTLREAIHKHFIADLATLETLVDNKQAILLDFYNFFAGGMKEVDSEPFKTYVITDQSDPGRVADLIELLNIHGIEVYRNDRSLNATRAQTYFDVTSRARTIPAGSFIIPLQQPRKRFIKTMFEPDPKMEDSFMAEVEARRQRDARLGSLAEKEGHGFYDITAWALPLLYGLETIFTEENIDISNFTRIEGRPVIISGIEGGEASYAYAFSQSENAGTKLAGRLLQMGYKVAITLLPTTVEGHKLDKGTYLARVNRNPEDLHGTIRSLSEEYGTRVTALNTAWGEGGITLGSKYVRNLRKPKIAVMTKDPTLAVTFGSVYSVLTQRFDLDFTALRTSMFNDFDLYRYNVIIFPDGSPSGYHEMLGDEGVQKLRQWIKNGGTFIGIKDGAAFTTREGIEFTDVQIVRENSGGNPIENIPGSIFKGVVNNDYYLGLGHPDEIAIQFRGNYHLTPTKHGANVVTYKPDGYVMGHVWESTEEELGGKLFMADVPLGDGQVILFADDPTFRAYWKGLDRLFVGAIVMSGLD